MATESIRIPLAWRVAIAGFLAAALALGCVAAWTWHAAQEAGAAAARQALARAAVLHEGLAAQRQRMLERSASVIANDAGLASYLAASLGDDLGMGAAAMPDVQSLRDLLAERRQQFGFDLGMLLDADAGTLARSDRGESFVLKLGDDPLVALARRDLTPHAGYWRFEGALYQAAIVPMTQDGALLGFLLLAQRVDDAASRELASVSGSDIAYWMRGNAELSASSLSPALAARLPGMGASQFGDRSIDLAGRAWWVHATRLAFAGTAQTGIWATLLPQDVVSAGFGRVARQAVLAACVLCVSLVPLLYWLGRRALAPLDALATKAEAIAAGDPDARLPARGRDGLARIARAVSTQAASLREKRDIETYVAEVSRHMPATAEVAVTTTSPSRTGQAARDVDTLPPGTRLGPRYEIVDQLGSGGMGVVYKARDLELGDVVALKMLRGQALGDAIHVERLKDEIRLARRITHPNVLRTFDFAEIDGRAFVSMEYVHGITLRRLIRPNARPPYMAALRIARQLAAGLQAAHAVGVLHRDIKPENIILAADGDAKLMDFGIARPMHRDVAGHTQAGTMVGSPDYAPPEQLNGGVMDQRSDVYACGVVFSELFCGVRPYQGMSAVDIYMAQTRNELLRPSMAWPDIPPELEALILRCIALQPEARFRNATELSDALAGLA